MVKLRQLEVEDYERAEKLLPFTRSELVAGATVKPVWIEGGARFWYRADGPSGHSFFMVEPAKGSRKPAFDHARLANALESASGESVDAAVLPFKTIQPSPGHAVEFDAFGTHWRCNLDSYTCQKVEGHSWPNPMEVKSPDGQWAVLRRDHNLWIRSLATGEGRALTSDGIPEYSYASPPDCLSFGTLMRRFGIPHLPPLVSWSSDSRYVFTHRIDQRSLRLSHLIESSPSDGGPPVLHSYRYAFPGDEAAPTAELIVFDAHSATGVTAKIAPVLTWLMSPIMSGDVWWSPDSTAVYLIEQPRDLKRLWLKRLDPATGEVRTLVEEKGWPYLAATQGMGKPIVRVFCDGEEALWYSQRDGWGHLYLYDTKSGALRCQVTSGEWAVQEILHVDERRRVVYFVASGLVKSDIYRRQVCRVGLDGKGFERLSGDNLDHIVTVSPDGSCFVDSASAVDVPPVTRVFDWSGDVVVELERADIAKLQETGWTAPERFCVKAADGITDIYGVLYRPHLLDETQRYPVIDSPYPGPQRARVLPSFGDRIEYDPESLAALGFVVVAVDGRGTPGRSKAFLDEAYGHLDTAGFLEDHVAAIRQLARSRPWMDLDRVGIFGLSGGGFTTVRALCAHPEFYKVGVASCGNHDQRLYQVGWGETHIGPLRDNGEKYRKASNADIADRLQGKLLLIHGEMDDNVHPHLTMRLVDRLIAANKDFELLIVPGAEHSFLGYIGYVYRRRWDFLVRHLMGAEPPSGYRISEPTAGLEAMFG